VNFILIIIYLIFTVGGIFLLKAGGDSLSVSLSNAIQFKMGYITLAGFICYFCSFLLWQKILVTFDVSYIVPITTGISQIIILVIGVMLFKEKTNWIGILGVLLVAAGVALIAIGKNRV